MMHPGKQNNSYRVFNLGYNIVYNGMVAAEFEGSSEIELN